MQTSSRLLLIFTIRPINMINPVFSSNQYVLHALRFLLSESEKAVIQFQIVLGMISKIKATRHTSELYYYDSITQVCNVIKEGLQRRCFLVINAKFLTL